MPSSVWVGALWWLAGVVTCVLLLLFGSGLGDCVVVGLVVAGLRV